MLVFILLTPTLSNRRGSQVSLQSIVFTIQKSCVDTYGFRAFVFFVSFVDNSFGRFIGQS